MRGLRLAATLALLGACSANSAKNCGPASIPAAMLTEVQNSTELLDSLTLLLTGHCRCDFAPALAEEITFDGRNVEVGFDPAKAECLGPLKVVSAETSLPNLGSLTVEQDLPQGGGKRFVIAFVHNGSRWLLYWPAPEKQRI